MRRDVNAQATRAELIRIARAAFTTQGYAAVKLGDIASDAHATTGAIYHHFGGKAGLMLAVGEHVEQEVVAAIEARIPPNSTPWDAIGAVGFATLDLCSRTDVARIIFKEAPNALGSTVWRAVEMRYGLGGLLQLFQRAAKAGELTPPDAALVTRLFMAALIEAVEAILDGPKNKSRRSSAEAAVAQLLEAFRNKV